MISRSENVIWGSVLAVHNIEKRSRIEKGLMQLERDVVDNRPSKSDTSHQYWTLKLLPRTGSNEQKQHIQARSPEYTSGVVCKMKTFLRPIKYKQDTDTCQCVSNTKSDQTRTTKDVCMLLHESCWAGPGSLTAKMTLLESQVPDGANQSLLRQQLGRPCVNEACLRRWTKFHVV